MDFSRIKRNPLIVNKKIFQPALLFGSLIMGMGFAFISSMFTTRYLNPTEFGNMKFITTLWYLLEIAINCGFFHSAGQALLAENDPVKTREIIGTDILIASFMGLALTLITLAIAEPLEWLFRIEIAKTLIVLAPLMIVYPLKDALMLIFQCTNKIFLLALLNVIPQFLFLVFLLIAPYVFTMKFSVILVAQQTSLLVVVLLLITIVMPSFQNIKTWYKRIKGLQKTYGWPVYMALLSGNATQQINRLAIVYWVDSQAIGFYALASQLVDPLRLIPSSVASASFRDFAGKRKISNKLFVATLTMTALSLLAYRFLLERPLSWLYPVEYARQVGPMSQALAVGAIVLGFAELLNRFLGAHGKGRELKLAAYCFGGIYLLGFFIMTPLWGVWGTIYSSIFASLCNLSVMWYFYRKNTYSTGSDIQKRDEYQPAP